MSKKIIKFEGKVIIKENVGAKELMALLQFLTEGRGFAVQKFESDEIKLVKNEFTNEQDGQIEITKSNVAVEIEIEASESNLEVEIESESLELVRDLTTEIAARL